MKSPGQLISDKVAHFFKETGIQVYRHPAPFLWIPILVTVASCVGLLRFHEENRIWYLYSPTGAPSHYEHAVANEFFDDRGGKFWLEVSITAHDMGNLLRKEYLDEVDSISQYLQYNFTVPCSLEPDGECSFSDLCAGACNDNQVIPIFNLIYRNASQRLHPNFRLTFPTMHLYNDEYYVGEHFAGVEINQNTQRISSVKVIMLYFRTDRQNAEVDESLKRWEQRLFDYSSSFQNPLLNMTCSSDGMISKEVRRNGMSCMPYFSLSVVMVYIFIFISNKRAHMSTVHNGVMAFLGVIGPLMAVATTFCILFLLGFAFNAITLVMPFLIIGVGSDDVFIIIHAFRKTNNEPNLEKRIAHAMEEAGPSITVTSITNCLSFGIGALTPTPAISTFCLYTAVGVAIDFVYQLTFFVAALVYEERRVEKETRLRKKALEEKKAAKIYSSQISCEGEVRKKNKDGIVSRYCRVLKLWQTRTVLLFISLGYWLVSYQGCIQMEIKMETTNLVLKDSPLNNVKHIYEEYLWREGQLVFVFVNNPPDVSTFDGQSSMFSLVDQFERLPFSMGKNSTSFWLRSFLSQRTLYVRNNETFYNLLGSWMEDPENGGSRWNDMVRLEKNGDNVTGIQKFMFATACAMGDQTSWNTRGRLQKLWRGVAAQYSEFNVSVFQPYSYYVDQIDSIGSTTLSTVIVAALTMDIACFLMIPSASSILSSTVAMVSINIGVFGLLSHWGVNLDPITMCTTLMSIGFSVDFTAHISYHYYRNPVTWTTDERLADALRSIGWPMIQAGCSTILCVTPLLLVDSYMVRVFWKTIFLVITLGLLHGIVFLPAFLLTVSRGQQKVHDSSANEGDFPSSNNKSDSSLETQLSTIDSITYDNEDYIKEEDSNDASVQHEDSNDVKDVKEDYVKKTDQQPPLVPAHQRRSG